MHKSLLLYNIQQQCYGVCVNGYVFVLGYVTKKIFFWIEYKSRSPKKPHLFREQLPAERLQGAEPPGWQSGFNKAFSSQHNLRDQLKIRDNHGKGSREGKKPVIQIHTLVFKHGKNKSAKSNVWCVQTFLKTALKRVTIKNVNQSWQGP